MALHGFDRRAFMRMVGITGGTGLVSGTAAGVDETDEEDDSSRDEGTVVQVLSIGGTIASTPGDGGASPSESGEALIESVPELNEHADEILVDQVTQLGSFNLDQENVAALGVPPRSGAGSRDSDRLHRSTASSG